MSVCELVSQLNTDSPPIQRLNITAFNWWQECLHGVLDRRQPGRGATIFPQPLGLAAAFDVDLVHRVSNAISDELRAKDNEQFRESGRHMMTSTFAPNINIFRDPRWGRGSETYGEDPKLTSEMAKAFVRGLQGNHSKYVKAGATCKHFAAYSLEQWQGISRFAFDAVLDPRDVEDTYLPAFRACVSEAGASSVMCSYNAINGTPACASQWLLSQQLRGKMRFDGFVVSDCGAVDSIWQHHQYANSSTTAAAAALKAGTDLNCGDYSGLIQAEREGLVTRKEVAAAVKRVLLARFRLGHFDDPDEANPYSKIQPSVIGSHAHLALAREAALKSIVLLKNEPTEGNGKALLPLDVKVLQKITVVGPLANRSEYLLGNYYGQPWGSIVTPLQAIQDFVWAHAQETATGEAPTVDYLVGAEVMGTGADVDSVVAACRTSDVCIFVVGSTMLDPDVKAKERAGTYTVLAPVVESEGYDRRSLLLPGSQMDLIQAAAKRTSTPLVVVLVHGGPLDVEWLQTSTRVGAILTAWFPGQGGASLADVLFGRASPSGRLPVTFYSENYTRQVDMGDMRMRPWPGRTHRFLQVPPLYPFGHGLSYATFAYSRLALSHLGSTAGSKEGRKESSRLAVSVTVANTGSRAADEVILVFLSYVGDTEHLKVGQVPGMHSIYLPCGAPLPGWGLHTGLGRGLATPRQVLAAFQRVHLEPGESRGVELGFEEAELAAASSGALAVGGGQQATACGLYEVRVGAVREMIVIAPEGVGQGVDAVA
ncbi:hypothetical protein N2152v2_007752 [Parachlorella kessleri]